MNSHNPKTDEQNSPDTSVIQLFQSDLAEQKQILEDNLQRLEDDPEDSTSLEAIIEATRTWKGLAALVEFKTLADLAGAVLDCLEIAKESSLSLERINTLDGVVDLLYRISELEPEKAAAWPGAIEEEVRELIRSLQPPCGESEAPFPLAADKGFSVLDDPAMLEVFKIEISENSRILNEGLIDLEHDPDSLEILEAVMRAAHSVKGAARVMGLDPAVELAHLMEDCFVAAQNKEIRVCAEHTEIFLRGVDMLDGIAQAACSDSLESWALQHEKRYQDLISAISSIRSGNLSTQFKTEPTDLRNESGTTAPNAPDKVKIPVSIEKSTAKESFKKGVKSSRQSLNPVKNERTVRVTAAKIERLIGFAGEFTVSTQWLPSFAASLLNIKKNFSDSLSLLDHIHEGIKKENTNEVLELIQEGRDKLKKALVIFSDNHNELDLFINRSTTLSDRLYHEAVEMRMRPFTEGIRTFPRLVRDTSRRLGKKARLLIKGQFTEVDQDILEKLESPLSHLLRNALDHGIESPQKRAAAGKDETGTLQLKAEQHSGMLMITVSDDGQGIDTARIKQKIIDKSLATEEMLTKMSDAELMEFLFLPGFSTTGNVTEISGRGVGLDIVHNMVHDVGGVARISSTPGAGVKFRLQLPLTLSIIRALLVEIDHEKYAFPLARIERCMKISAEQIVRVENSHYFCYEDKNIALISIRQILEIDEVDEPDEKLSVVVVSDMGDAYALVVDRFLEECELVVRPLDTRLGKVPNISTTALFIDNSPVLIFDVEDLIRSIDNFLHGKRVRDFGSTGKSGKEKTNKKILVADDSITVREMERQMLQNRGYLVEVAVDGMDAWHAVSTGHYDMVVTDVDMPRMNGIELIKQIRSHSDLQSLPVIVISYKDKERDRLAGMEAGANYYLTKSSFQDDSFMEAVTALIGEV